MGSAIIVDPAMRKLKANIEGELFFVIFSKNKISLDLLKTVKSENVYMLDESSIGSLIISAIKFIFWCRKMKIDSSIDLELFSRVTALLTFVSGAKNRVGFHAFHNEGLYRGDFLTKKVAYNPHQHIAKSFVALVDALLNPNQEIPYTKRIIPDSEIQIAKAVIDSADQKEVLSIIASKYAGFDAAINPVILVNSNASDLLPQRRWDRKNYCEVIKKILAYNDKAIILLTGAPAEFDGAQILVDCVNDK